MKVIISIIILFTACNLWSQVTIIPDFSFEQALIDYGYDVGPVDGSVPTANISGIISLDVSSRGIYDLDGIEDFTSLMSLYCASNQLTSLNLSQNLALTWLECNDNNLTSLNISANTSLEYLICMGNSLTSLYANSSSLQIIDCYLNQLTSLNVSNCPNLGILRCDINFLSTLDLTNNPNLQTLWCSYNSLTSLIAPSSSLTELLCDNNQLTYLDVFSMPSLNTLGCADNNLLGLDLSSHFISSFSAKNNDLQCLIIGNPTNYSWFTVTNNPDLICIETSDPSYAELNLSSVDLWSIFGMNCLCETGPNSITGNVQLDNDVNCIGEANLPSVIVFNDLGNYDLTDANGNYQLFTYASGPVVVSQFPISSPLFIQQTCPSSPATYSHTFTGMGQSVANFDFRDEIMNCPLLTASIIQQSTIRCFENQLALSYCNIGNVDTNNVSVFLDLPEFLTLQSASMPYTITSEGFYEFYIGTLQAGDCGTINLIDSVICAGILGETQCAYSWITPTNDCIYDIQILAVPWDQSSVDLQGTCILDSIIQFTITNAGSGDMSTVTEYRIYLDNQIIQSGPIQLLSGTSQTIAIISSGGHYRFEVDNTIGFPTVTNPNIVVESCVLGQTALIYNSIRPNRDGDVDLGASCRTIVGSYDPNIKTFNPNPIGVNNYIAPNTPIEYTIHFQNTGTSPAVNIVIGDTVSPLLDLSTYNFLASSHSVEIEIIGDTVPVLKFFFQNINLPDSTSDFLGSQGFVKFTLSSFGGLLPGTEIHNDADIYFDYNDPITTNDAWYTIYDTVPTSSGVTLCTSIQTTDSVIACNSYTWIDGNTYTATTNIPTWTLTNLQGCDSVMTLDLTIRNSNTGTDSITVCNSYTWIDGNTYAATINTPTWTLTNVQGCDSIVTLNLTINSDAGTDVVTSCDSYIWMDGNTYTANTNTPTWTLTNAQGCDSIVTLNLAINYSNTGTDIITSCDPYTWIDGSTYNTTTNTPTWTLANVQGCDSIVTLNLIINSNTGTDVVTACNSFTWIDGNIYSANTNTPTWTLTNVLGCDSIVTLNLTISNSTVGVADITACDAYTWIDGNTYTATTNTPTWTLTNALGCDSLVTLNLTMSNSTVGMADITACDTYTWIDGNTYTSDNNTASWTLTNAAGCDSSITLDLTILSGSSSTDVITNCGSYTWMDGITYSNSNSSAEWTLTNSEGCDSIISLNLTVNSVDASISQLDIATLQADLSGAVYQWLDCDNSFSIIVGETAQTYMALTEGNYAVQVTANGCTDTSACMPISFAGIYEGGFLPIVVYPNPSDGAIEIDLIDHYKEITINIYDANGKLIDRIELFNRSKINYSFNVAPGLYWLKIHADDKIAQVKIIKK